MSTMHFTQSRTVGIAWSFIIASLIVSYGAIIAGLAGYATAPVASWVIFSAVMAGCLAALVFLVVGTRLLRGLA
jgi:hypothetical protein